MAYSICHNADFRWLMSAITGHLVVLDLKTFIIHYWPLINAACDSNPNNKTELLLKTRGLAGQLLSSYYVGNNTICSCANNLKMAGEELLRQFDNFLGIELLINLSIKIHNFFA